MKRVFYFILGCIAFTFVSAQAVSYIATSIKTASSAPSGACSPRGAVRVYSNAIYVCPQSGTANWATVSGGSTNDPTPTFATLTDGATVTWAFTSPQLVGNATVTLGGNRTLAISGCSAGCMGTLKVVQDATGARTLALPAGSKVVNGGSGAVGLSTAANAIDILTFVYDGTNYFWTVGVNYN